MRYKKHHNMYFSESLCNSDAKIPFGSSCNCVVDSESSLKWQHTKSSVVLRKRAGRSSPNLSISVSSGVIVRGDMFRMR